MKNAILLPIKTERLIIQEESENDFERFYIMNTDPSVMQFINNGKIMEQSYEEARIKYPLDIQKALEKNLRTYAVYLKSSNQYIGWCGFVKTALHENWEFGYRFCADSWNHGYATEASFAVLNSYFTNTEYKEIIADVHKMNFRSQRVLAKLGFEKTGELFHNGVQDYVNLYSLKSDKFENAKGT